MKKNFNQVLGYQVINFQVKNIAKNFVNLQRQFMDETVQL